MTGRFSTFSSPSPSSSSSSSTRRTTIGEQNQAQHYDYIVIGAGSAGCVVTHRLAEAGKKVLLIEAGRSDRGSWDSWKIHMPSALAFNILWQTLLLGKRLAAKRSLAVDLRLDLPT